jgi:hypothetical protein
VNLQPAQKDCPEVAGGAIALTLKLVDNSPPVPKPVLTVIVCAPATGAGTPVTSVPENQGCVLTGSPEQFETPAEVAQAAELKAFAAGSKPIQSTTCFEPHFTRSAVVLAGVVHPMV